MLTLIIIFYASFIAMAVMILHKRYEVRSGHATFLSRLSQWFDHIFGDFFALVGRVVSYVNKHTFIAMAHWIAFHVLVRIRKVYVEIKHSFISHPQGKKLIDAVRGRGEIRRHGASFYLRKISAEEK